jgi:hypothetical protein
MDGQVTASKADGAELTAAQLADCEEEEQQQRANRKLLAEALKWARINGYARERVYEMGQFSGYGWDAPCGRVHFCPLHDPVIYYWGSAIQPGNAREAVDVLCALGILPAHLSSAWLAGRVSVYDRVEYRVMVPGLSGQGLSTDSTIEAFRDLGWWRRRGHPDAWLERRFSKEPTEWERVPDAD